MSEDEQLRSFRNADPVRKLAILRSEMRTPITTIRGFVAVMKKYVPLETGGQMPPDFPLWLEAISESADQLDKVLSILTDPDKTSS